jgi:transposase
VDDPAVQRTLRQTRTRKPFPNHSPAMKNACGQRVPAARSVVVR